MLQEISRKPPPPPNAQKLISCRKENLKEKRKKGKLKKATGEEGAKERKKGDEGANPTPAVIYLSTARNAECESRSVPPERPNTKNLEK